MSCSHFRPEKGIVERIAEAMIDANCRGFGATYDVLKARGFSRLDLEMYGAEARQRANAMFDRKSGGGSGEGSEGADGGAKDGTAPDDTGQSGPDILLRIPAAELCQLWQGLRENGAVPTIAATVRLEQALEGRERA